MKSHFYSRKAKGRFVLLAIVIFAVVTLVVMLLWNWLMPTIFSLSPINYWQALGLLVLSKILFSGFHKGGHKKPYRSHWKQRFMEKWADCSEEEKEDIKESINPNS